ncbi:hypothetical protein ACQR1W_35360 [Bradyrhizobium sp. HKCCYLS1011]|uniref:hypothetical protein n=1 Tax=Bradyrhizobium sp. HKCCYLS1011 TaxID=3420733 RepID=UPI003EBC480B
MSHYIVVVTLVLKSGSADGDTYDVWDYYVPVDASGPKDAVRQAVSHSKEFDQWSAMAYQEPPVIRGVRAVHSGLPSISGAEREYPSCHLRMLVGTIDRKNVDLLKSFEEILMPFSFIYIDREEVNKHQAD